MDPVQVAAPEGDEHEKAGFSRRAFVAGTVGVAAVAVACSDDPTTNPTDGGTDGGQQLGPVSADSIFRIHPGIGFGRVGNADPNTYFIGPELPGYPPSGEAPGTAAPPYKVDGMIKPQAARFRVFEYRRIGGKLTPVREVTLDSPGVVRIEWRAHLANTKASFFQFNGPQGERTNPASRRNSSVTDRSTLEINFGPRTITGRSQPPAEFRPGTSADPSMETYPRKSDGTPVIDYLGQLRTDDKGRLIVLGGHGIANFQPDTRPALPNYANCNGWYDDVSDGPVTCTVVVDVGGTPRSVPVDDRGAAWVIFGPPDYAPGVHAPTSVYELLYDLAVRGEVPIPADNALYSDGGPLEMLRKLHDAFQETGPAEFPNVRVDFTDDIAPILKNTYNMRWVTNLAVGNHETLLDPMLGDPGAGSRDARVTVFSYVRPPGDVPMPADAPKNMPAMLGNDPYNTRQPNWVRRLPMTRTQVGILRQWSEGSFTAARTTPRPTPEITAHGLDRASMENCSGGAFYPGIECGWQIRAASLYIEPFRINPNGTSSYMTEDGMPLKPGHFTRQMALPWHADFMACRREDPDAWWPTQRPDDLFTSATSETPVAWARPLNSFLQMVENWYKLGFIVPQGNAHLEQERNASVP